MWIMHVDVEASVACQHIDHLDSAVAIAGSTMPAVVVLESCSHRERRVLACLRLREGEKEHHQGTRRHRQCRRHFLLQKVQVR